MIADEVKTKLEGVKWINKEIKGLYLESYKCSEAKRGYAPED